MFRPCFLVGLSVFLLRSSEIVWFTCKIYCRNVRLSYDLLWNDSFFGGVLGALGGVGGCLGHSDKTANACWSDLASMVAWSAVVRLLVKR